MSLQIKFKKNTYCWNNKKCWQHVRGKCWYKRAGSLEGDGRGRGEEEREAMRDPHSKTAPKDFHVED